MNVNLILAETQRSEFYLKSLIKAKINIDSIFYYSKIKKNTYKLIKENKLLHKMHIFQTLNINNKKLVNTLCKNISNKKTVFSGYPGEIVRDVKLLKKNLIHCHSGDLPYFKGSTTFYYAILKKKRIAVSVIIINQIIDNGKIIYKKFFNPLLDKKSLEKNYDDNIRSKTLINFLSTKNKLHKYSNNKNSDKFIYYIAHPLLRKLVENKYLIKELYK